MADVNMYLSVTSAVIALSALIINVYYNFLRGPKIICGSIRYIVVGNRVSRNSSIIYVPLIFTNVGSNTGVVESVIICSKKLSELSEDIIYYAQNDEFDIGKLSDDYMPLIEDYPVLEFVVNPKSSVIKNI